MDLIRFIPFTVPVGVLAAEDESYFAAESLQVEITRSPGSGPQLQGLLEGRWDIASTAPDNSISWVEERDADFVIFMVREVRLNQNLWVALAITSLGDLRGQTLAVDSADSGYSVVLRRMLRQNGVSDSVYEFLAGGSTANRMEAMAQGRAAGALLTSPNAEAEALGSGNWTGALTTWAPSPARA